MAGLVQRDIQVVRGLVVSQEVLGEEVLHQGMVVLHLLVKVVSKHRQVVQGLEVLRQLVGVVTEPRQVIQESPCHRQHRRRGGRRWKSLEIMLTD